MVSTKAESDSVVRPVGLGEIGDLLSLLFGPEMLVTGANLGLVEASTLFEGVHVLGDLLPHAKKLGVGLNQSDELLAADLELLRILSGLLRDQLHDVVVVDHGRGEEDELEVELIDLRSDCLTVLTGQAALFLETPGGF